MLIFSYILDLLFPPKCPFCRKLLEKNQLLCLECQTSLPRLSVEEQRWRIGEVLTCYGVLWYRDNVPHAVKRFKFFNAPYYKVCFGTLMSEIVEQSETYHVITWVPMFLAKEKKRGYNQAELLAREIAKITKIALEPLLEKWKDTVPQSTLDDDAMREKNAENIYRMSKMSKNVKNYKILLVDDVVTTGNTLISCVQVLLEAGVQQVDCITLARSRK